MDPLWSWKAQLSLQIGKIKSTLNPSYVVEVKHGLQPLHVFFFLKKLGGVSTPGQQLSPHNFYSFSTFIVQKSFGSRL
jgi:hypothetical protein